MKRYLVFLIAVILMLTLAGCFKSGQTLTVAATTLPVYTFTSRICADTNIEVTQLISENVSCLHDYTLQVSQMKALEQADAVVISGAGLEVFMEDMLAGKVVVDASAGISLNCNHHEEVDYHDHNHDEDPHIWLAPENAKIMAENICRELSVRYPQYTDIFANNLARLHNELDALQEYGEQMLSALPNRQLLTFHDGFGYLANTFDLTILRSIEEESGREASAAELIELCELVEEHNLPAIFTERSGSTSAAEIISRETGAEIFQLDMAMGATGYFDAMYHNINTLKEALE